MRDCHHLISLPEFTFQTRVSYNGSTWASQAWDVGSIPITRSTFILTHKNSVILDFPLWKRANLLQKLTTLPLLFMVVRYVIYSGDRVLHLWCRIDECGSLKSATNSKTRKYDGLLCSLCLETGLGHLLIRSWIGGNPFCAFWRDRHGLFSPANRFSRTG